ncbi:hypothetical protein SAMN05444349_14223 [Bacteroides faecichinchillae]|uniref:Uncharacterized protein n=2 Tax=Bacteroides faecichinchillae TaxID=871325 RepID=A0A1M5FB54_9BACE|nr:hypothetical protein SAMN05444349_14223 [Bacteroides faecichinchillae]
MRKSKEEILSILCITDGSYRVMKSRARKRFNIEDDDWEAFLQKLK